MPLYHTHLTLMTTSEATPPKTWKATTIILNGVKTQTDFMLTKHYYLPFMSHESVLEVLLKDASTVHFLDAPLARIKIEQISDFTLPVTEEHYVEAHMLVYSDDKFNLSSNWVRSRNPKSVKQGKPTRFFNRRIYHSSCFDEAAELIRKEVLVVPYIDLKLEQVIYDSNVARDKWWA